ncbi:MAG TPA: YihY/virulence factor BrkB family protein [Opitutaceae bacterium]|jgi:membrane protein
MERFLDVILLTGRTYHQTRASTRAAALSFSTLLGLGPLIALIVIIGTPILGQRDPLLAARAISHVVHLIAPQIDQYEQLSNANVAAAPSYNPKLREIIDGFVTGAHRGTVGTFGAVSLVVIVFLLFGTIENSFNEIWGVRHGRSFFRTILFQLTFLLIGGALFFSAAALLSVGAFIDVFIEHLPVAAQIIRWFLPIAAFAFLTAVLTLGYRLIPNTKVTWRSASIGASVVTALLLINNFLAFFYLRRVILTRSLYGSLGVVPILMIGLYVFWLFVLIGGQISFAVQNVPATANSGRFSS